MTDWQGISQAAGISLRGETAQAQPGGCISTAMKLESSDGPVFVKLEPPQFADRLAAEADGLAALAHADVVRVPAVVACGICEEGSGQAFLIIEWIESIQHPAAAAALGTQLAALHQQASPTFGWHRDNYIGATPQVNTVSDSWIDFLRDQRLGYQLQLAASNGYRLNDAHAAHLLSDLAMFYSDYRPRPSLLHGDLWGGNWFADEHGAPVIFDPAVYYGDREADLAMTELFAGFGADFYAAYAQAWALDPGYSVRRDLHQLYHVLNHLNLFGGGYLNQANAVLAKLCAALG